MNADLAASHLFPGPTPLHALFRTHDWSTTSLGKPERWPTALRVIVGLMLDSKLPMAVVWGPERILLYNAPYVQFLGGKHPWALGRQLQEVWPEIWGEIGALVDRARDGEAFHSEDMPLAIQRNGRTEQAWFTFFFSPVRDDRGTIQGMCSSVVETTSRVMAEKRQAFLLSLTDALRQLSDPGAIMRTATELIGRHLSVSQMMYGDIRFETDAVVFHSNYTDGRTPPLTGVFSLSGYGPRCIELIAQGRNLVIHDVLTDPRTDDPGVRQNYLSAGAGAVLSVPLMKQGRQMTVLVATHRQPHQWTDEEVALVEEVAQRTWSAVEQARAEDALRQLNQTLEERVALRTAQLEKAQQEAIRAAHRLQFTLNSAEIGEWDLDLVRDTSCRSLRHDQCFGYQEPIADWGFETFIRHVHPEDRDRVEQQFRTSLTELKDWHFECRVIWPDRSVHWIAAHGSIYHVDGKPTHMSGVVFDITERKSSEEVLRASEKRQALLLALGDRLRELSDDPDAMMAAATQTLALFLGVPRVGYASVDEALQYATLSYQYTDPARLPEIAPRTDRLDDYGPVLIEQLRAGIAVRVDDVAADPRTHGAPAQVYAALGARATLAAPVQRNARTIAIMFANHDAPRAWADEEVDLLQQVADRSWVALERARAVAALKDADRRKDEFLAMLAHELRNPLAPISAAAEIMGMIRLDEERLKRTSQMIARQVRHMSGLVDDLLDVSRVTRGLVAIEKTPQDMKSIVSGAVEQVRPLIEAQRHRLAIDLAPEPALVLGDQKRLVQVLTNLLNNAAKYTPAGGNIHLCMEVQEGQVVLSVSDDGIGIAPELQPHVFELFAQAQRSPDRSQGGLGIGLALVKSLVELHGGKAVCSSAGCGKGSRFTVSLPRAAAVSQPSAHPVNPLHLHRVTRRSRVLLVDDNADAAEMLAMFLEAAGHDVLVEHHPRRALQRARVDLPDACVLDIGLPEMDGYEMARQLRARPETARATLIAVTGYGQEHDRQAALAAGFDHHLVKPVDAARLALLIEGSLPQG